MWEKLPSEDKKKYERLILAFSSLTEMFTQKSLNENEIPAPIINSKFQETAFQKSFGACVEDIGNTSYDVSLNMKIGNEEIKYLIGIKTFGIASGDQKVAQFKASQPEFSYLFDLVSEKSKILASEDKQIIDDHNEAYYKEIATIVSKIRNERIDSSVENLKGFNVSDDDNIESVYHVLMPSKKGDKPQILVGEIEYDKIDINNIKVLGSTSKNNPVNFGFTDGKHTYKYTASDSQLYMSFDNKNIIKDTWDVIYAADAHSIFSDIADKIYGTEKKEQEENKAPSIESYSWSLINKDGEVEKYSGFNLFYAVGSKLPQNARKQRCDSFYEKYLGIVDKEMLDEIYEGVKNFLLILSKTDKEKDNKVCLRKKLYKQALLLENQDLINDLTKLLFRATDEIYIPIPNSKEFHFKHPDFFVDNIGEFIYDKKTGKNKFVLSNKECRKFKMIFEPSGDSLDVFIAQDKGKAIESCEKQSYLGEWFLKKVFQLKPYEPLTAKKLKELNINGIRLYKEVGSSDIHFQFIWIDEEDLPDDYIE